MLQQIDHENINKLYEKFEDSEFIFLILEYVDNCDLLSFLKQNGAFSERNYLPIFIQIIRALSYLHEKRILHRDIKLDNILLDKKGTVKLCDFGVSRKMSKGKKIYEHIGTPAYLAPEIIKEKGYSGFQADIWSLGIMTYISITGLVPFKGESLDELNHNILHKKFQIPYEICHLSPNFRIAIKGMLDKNPQKRMILEDLADLFNFELELPQERTKHQIDPSRVKRIMELGFSKETVLKSLLKQQLNHVSTIYRLLE